MTERVIVTLHLPLPMGEAARILKAVAREFPDAWIREPAADGAAQIVANDSSLSKAERRRIAADRRLPDAMRQTTP